MNRLPRVKKFLPFFLVLSLILTAGCEKDKIEKAKDLVKLTEKKAEALKEEIDYEKRLIKYKEHAFAVPNEALITETENELIHTQANIDIIKDKKTKDKFNSKLKKVKNVISQAKSLANALKSAPDFLGIKDDFQKLLYSSPLSPNLDEKLAFFQKNLDAANKTKTNLEGEALQNEYEARVIGNSKLLIEEAKKIISARNSINKLNQTIINYSPYGEIESQSREAKSIISTILPAEPKAALEQKHEATLKPYIARVQEERWKRQRKRN